MMRSLFQWSRYAGQQLYHSTDRRRSTSNVPIVLACFECGLHDSNRAVSLMTTERLLLGTRTRYLRSERCSRERRSVREDDCDDDLQCPSKLGCGAAGRQQLSVESAGHANSPPRGQVVYAYCAILPLTLLYKRRRLGLRKAERRSESEDGRRFCHPPSPENTSKTAATLNEGRRDRRMREVVLCSLCMHRALALGPERDISLRGMLAVVISFSSSA